MAENIDMTGPVQVARRCIERYELSGYGTPRDDRYTPTFGVDDVVLMARSLIELSDAIAGMGGDGEEVRRKVGETIEAQARHVLAEKGATPEQIDELIEKVNDIARREGFV